MAPPRKKWIQSAVHPERRGTLRRALHAKKGKPIPIAVLQKAAKKPGKLGQRARFAVNVRPLAGH
jgi:hypothetical protein